MTNHAPHITHHVAHHVSHTRPHAPLDSSSPRLTLHQVVRYSALVGGIGYGILHRRTLQVKADVKAAHAEYKHKEHLIQQAKEAYKNRLVAKQSATGGTYSDSASAVATGWVRGEQRDKCG